MRVHYSIDEQPPEPEGFADRWSSVPQALTVCWLRGIRLAMEKPELAQLARAGELPVLWWKGGVDKPLKVQRKFGSLHYLATLQGLRGTDLDIETDADIPLTCSRYAVTVTFTGDLKQLGGEGDTP
jgi:hypothetical protein